MRAFLFIVGCWTSALAHTQWSPGFDPAEARDMSALCVTHTFKDLYGDDSSIIPAGYQRIYVSPTRGLDNKFQVFRRGDVVVVEIRGSTAKAVSWMENMYAAMIPASGTIHVEGVPFPYHFADDTTASVHAGYALGISFIAEDVVSRLHGLAQRGVRDVIITGHSQGGALALLLRAYLEHVPETELGGTLRFKTYAFGHPMVGNKAFHAEFDRRCVRTGPGTFSVQNAEDPVTRMPVRVEEGRVVASEVLQAMLFAGEPFDAKSTARNALFQLFGDRLVGLASSMGGSIEKRIAGAVGEVRMPPYRQALDYEPMPGSILLDPFPYPLMLRDSTILSNDSIMRAEPRGPDGVFLNKDLYRKPSSFYQHKPYNYHVGILRRYFPDAYERLERKQLPENL